MPEIEMPEVEGAGRSRLFSVIAVSVALLSAFLAIAKIKDDNTVQTMIRTKSDAVDTWNEYQAKRLKLHLDEAALAQGRALRPLLPAGPAAEQLDHDLGTFNGTIERYAREADELQAKAKSVEAKVEALNFVHDQFDVSDAFLSIALAVLAVCALTRQRWLLAVAGFAAAVGVAMGLAGLTGGSLNPDFLARWLG